MLGERFVIMPVKFIHSVEDQLIRTFGPLAAANFVYEMGRDAGKHYYRLVSAASYDTDKVRDFQRVGQELVGLWGWGGFNQVEFDLKKLVARSQSTNSIFVRNKTGKSPVCHYMRGLEAGLYEVAFGKRCESIEVLCEGKGDTNCELVTGKPLQISRLAENMD